MLEQIDIAVGFSVVMLLLSLLITIIVQAMSSVFDLRGRNLVWGITKVLHQIDPEFEQKAKRDWNELKATVGKRIAEAVSEHPSIAHSLASLKPAIARKIDEGQGPCNGFSQEKLEVIVGVNLSER